MLEGCTNITESSPNGSAATGIVAYGGKNKTMNLGPDDKCIRFLINETEVEMTLMIMIQGRQNVCIF
jgi:hypothetical protein